MNTLVPTIPDSSAGAKDPVGPAKDHGGGNVGMLAPPATSRNLAQSQQEANELGANPSSPALDPIALSSGSVVAAGAISPGPRRKSWSKARNMRAEERLRIMREAIDRG